MTPSQVRAAIVLTAGLIVTGCASVADILEEEPKTCDEACEDTYISCLRRAYDTVTDTSVHQAPYDPLRYPPQQTTTTTTTREVPSRSKEERCRLDFERCMRGCAEILPPLQEDSPATSDAVPE